MADVFNSSGLQVKTLDEIKLDLITNFKLIYGNDINLDQNSPDGQLLNIFAQAMADFREVLVQVNNGFDPDRAIGSTLDERVAINNIQRLAGSFTIQPITITTDRTVLLQGLDANYNNTDGTGYTVQDNAGNQFILVDSVTLTAGTIEKNFRAKNIGKVLTTVGTIASQATVVLGVTSINNPNGALQIGKNEETDYELRTRRQQSVALASNGYLNGLLAAVLNLNGVTDAKLFENVTDTVDANGIPAHGIWLIVEGGANSDIGNLIYRKKSYGTNMTGAVTYTVTTASGASFVAKFDRPTSENLYIKFNLQTTVTGTSFDLVAIKAYIVNAINYAIAEAANTATITAVALNAINATSGGGVPVDVFISKNGSTWVDYFKTTSLGNQFVLDVSRIAITII